MRRNAALPLDQVLIGDSTELLGQLPNKSVDLVFADPPYNLQLNKELLRPNMSRVDAVDDEWDQFQNFAAYDAFCDLWLRECRRVLKDTGTIWVIGSYHNIYRLGTLMMDIGFWLLNDVVWIKTNPTPQFRGVRFTNAHETLLWCKRSRGQRRYTFNYQMMKNLNDEKQMRSDWVMPICTGQERLRVGGVKAHPTQKPEALLYRVLLASTNPGDVVLDPFFGTGTTGAVAKALGRHFVGIEREEGYAELARERIARVAEAPAAPQALTLRTRKAQPRVRFGALLEAGMLRAGQQLFFQRTGQPAMVCADGTLSVGELRGSIHGLGAALAGQPSCNGWEVWLYARADGSLGPLDELRERYRAERGAS
ncbi:site-specific DNA-methyltransferase [Chloroflexia bacterium SDU3-3]|nr:site-specific DNA-methyltransferase [Chloroflexia bacterium SDU3-3]